MDKRKKKYFQGLEHLKSEIETSQETTAVTEESLVESRFLKKDLIKVIILMIIFIVVIAGLTVLDKQTTYLTDIAQKITSIFIK